MFMIFCTDNFITFVAVQVQKRTITKPDITAAATGVCALLEFIASIVIVTQTVAEKKTTKRKAAQQAQYPERSQKRKAE